MMVTASEDTRMFVKAWWRVSGATYPCLGNALWVDHDAEAESIVRAKVGRARADPD